MIRMQPKGYLPPWSHRREISGLMGTFLVFLMGFPGHSESTLYSARQWVRQMIQVLFVFFGLSTRPVETPVIPAATSVPPASSMVHKAKHPAARKTVEAAKPAPTPEMNSMMLRLQPVLIRFNYVFEGKATFNEQPCPNASVLVRLISGDRTVTKGTVTEADGSYKLKIAIDAMDKSPVDWSMEAFTPEFKKVELSGRQIVQREEDQDKQPIVVSNPVELLSLSK